MDNTIVTAILGVLGGALAGVLFGLKLAYELILHNHGIRHDGKIYDLVERK
jgi:hypothetical protein